MSGTTLPSRTPDHPDPDSIRSAALAYARRGWHVFPLVPGDKRPAISEWERRASTSDKRIHAWFAGTHRGAGIGIACGPAGLVAVDLDRPKPNPAEVDRAGMDPAGADLVQRDPVDGLATLRRLADGRPIPMTWTVATASGGWHLYYAAPTGLELGDGGELRNTTGRAGSGLGPMVDTRAAGGYVVAPPTVLPYGGYRVARNAPVALLPGWILAALTDPHRRTGRPCTAPQTAAQIGSRLDAYTAAAVAAQLAHLAGAESGRRNLVLYVSAVRLGELAAAGALTAEHARAVLLGAAGPHITAGAYTLRQAHATITSGLAEGARHPRQIQSIRPDRQPGQGIGGPGARRGGDAA